MINFPTSPEIGTVYTINNKEFIWNGIGFIPNSNGGGGSGLSIVSDTYENIKILVDSNELIPESTYIITDYQTVHVIYNSNPININYGEIEPLAVIAATTNTFYIEAKSYLFPNDIIHYDFNKNLTENNMQRKGHIIYRKDTVNNLSTHYDWRNYKFRRWNVDAINWISGSIYTPRNVVKSSDGNIYKCILKTSELDIEDPSLDYKHWVLWLILENQSAYGTYLSHTRLKNQVRYGNIITTNLLNPTLFNDFYTFHLVLEPSNSSGIVKTTAGTGAVGFGFNNIEIGKPSILNNGCVFYLIQDGNTEKQTKNNTIKYLNGGNTIFCPFINNNIVNLSSNVIFDNMNNNSINEMISCSISFNFWNNIIGSNFSNNTISYNCVNNNMGNDFSINTINPGFSNNIINYGFSTNNILYDFANNRIFNNFSGNIIGGNFYNNTIKSEFIINTVGDSFIGNQIETNFIGNKVGDNFTNNEVKFDITNIDWLDTIPTPTHVYQSYNCTMFSNSAGTPRLSYYDENDQLIITDPTE